MSLKAPAFWQVGKRYHPFAIALSPLGLVWSVAGVLRRMFAKPYKASIPVICVGNITAGGTGKTPTALALLHYFGGLRVCFLTRGFGGSHKDCALIERSDDAALYGDEAVLLSQYAPTIVSADRVQGLRLAEAQGFELVIADDGLQNPHFVKDISIAVIDGAVGFGNGRIIPAGPLREPVEALSGLDCAIIVGADAQGVAATLPCPVLYGQLVPEAPMPDNSMAYVAFAGIGRPDKFFDSLKAAGYTLVAQMGYGDHYRYSAHDMANLRAVAAQHQAGLITTLKDYMRLDPAMRRDIAVLRVFMALEGDMNLITPKDLRGEMRA